MDGSLMDPPPIENHHLMKLAQLLLSIITLETVICFGKRSPLRIETNVTLIECKYLTYLKSLYYFG